MLRVLVVDDSPTARECLVQILAADPEIQVVGVANNGREGVQLTQKLQPDIVTMDIQMPVMNGFEATREIMVTAPRPIVVVSTSTMVADAENAMRALRAGALTLISKPQGPAAADFQQTAKQLVETVKIMADVKVIRRRRDSSALEPTDTSLAQIPRVDVVAIVASTGGPPALQTVLSGLPAGFPAPILVVQHLAAGFIAGLASWLDASVSLQVKIAESGELMSPGTVYVGPDDQHLGVTRHGGVLLSDEPAMDGFRPSGNFLFESVATKFGASVIAVIMTGMGRDGVRGLQAIRAAGGRVFAQDAESCVVNGMPGAAVSADVVHKVVRLEDIARELQLYAGQVN